jgi:serine/threonine-protein kinase HipA
MPDVEVHIDLDGEPRRVGLLRRNVLRRIETLTFEYDDGWLADDNRFSIEPALTLTRGVFPPPQGQSIFGSIGDYLGPSADATRRAPPSGARRTCHSYPH